MTKPPDDFLLVEEADFRHEYSSGKRGEYFWLASNRIFIPDVLNRMEPRLSGLRLLQPSMVDNCESQETFVLADMQTPFPELIAFGHIFVFDQIVEVLPITSEAAKSFDRLCWSKEIEELVWSLILAFAPKHYFFGGTSFYMATKDGRGTTRFMNSEFFKTLELRLREYHVRHRYSFWTDVGPEVGPEPCAEAGCPRMRVRLANRCIRHQFDWANKSLLRAYDGLVPEHGVY